MAKIMKRTVDALRPEPDRDVFAWDSELRGFGIRVKPSGVKTFLIQYRNAEARTSRLVLGQYGALTPEAARDLARKKLTAVAEGEDPSADRHAVRAGMSVAKSATGISNRLRRAHSWSQPAADQGVNAAYGPEPDRNSHQTVARLAPRERPHPA